MTVDMDDVDVGMAVGAVVGGSAEIFSTDPSALRMASITNALQGQGVMVTGPALSSTRVAGFNAASVGGIVQCRQPSVDVSLQRSLTRN